MEQKAKRVGKFNIVDIIAVVLILAVAVFVGYKLMNRGDNATVGREMIKVSYTVRVEGVATEFYENCQAHIPSPLMASGALVGGQIMAVKQEPYYVLDANGNWVEDPSHVTLLFSVETETPVTEVMTTKVGDQEIRIGKSNYILKSEYIEFSGCSIVDVTWGE